MQNLVIGLDFDGTVVEHNYPYIGNDIPYCIPVLKELQRQGAKIVLNTMRSDKTLKEAVKYLTDKDIKLYGINKHPTQSKWTNSNKVYAHLYIDDAGFNAPLIRTPGKPYLDWTVVGKTLLGEERFNQIILN